MLELASGGDDPSPDGHGFLVLRAHLPHWEGLIHLVDRARRIAALDAPVADAGALTFQPADVPGALSAVQLAEGLVVLSMTCVVAWDVPARSAPVVDVPAMLALRAGEGLFGTLGAVRTERGYDVTLRYAFPAAGLDAAPLGTLLMLVISTASQLRSELLAQ